MPIKISTHAPHAKKIRETPLTEYQWRIFLISPFLPIASRPLAIKLLCLVGPPFLRPGLQSRSPPDGAAIRGSAETRAAAPCGEHGEHGEHWTWMAAASDATCEFSLNRLCVKVGAGLLWGTHRPCPYRWDDKRLHTSFQRRSANMRYCMGPRPLADRNHSHPPLLAWNEALANGR